MRRTPTIIAWILAASISALAQTPPAEPAFEVASVKPANSPIMGERFCGLPHVDPVRVSFSDCTLKQLVAWAYTPKDNLIEGGPGWIDSPENRYDVEATAGRPASIDQMRAMLRTLLADRFQLKMHQETQQRSVYAVIVAKRGPKLKVVTPGDALHGQIRFSMSGKMHILTGEKAPMTELALWLKSILNSSSRVVDETGLTEAYDFKLEWTPEDDLPTAALYGALQQQLGLKLEERKAAVEVLIVDHAEKALPNQ